MIAEELDLVKANEALAGMTAEDRVLWAVRVFGDAAVLLSSMQKTSCVLHHIFYKNKLENEILFVDTQYHFRETLELRDLFMRKYKLNIVTLYPEHSPEAQEREHGRKLYQCVDGQPICCKLRKEDPYMKHMIEHGKKLVIGGLRKEEGGKRKNLAFVMADPRFGGYSLYPLLDWDEKKLEAALAESGAPIHKLYSQSYLSIGCECCTTPVEPGEDARAGRWRHLRKEKDEPMYCGINYNEGGGI